MDLSNYIVFVLFYALINSVYSSAQDPDVFMYFHSFDGPVLKMNRKSHLCSDLKVNQACLTVENNAGVPVQLWTQSTECFKCPFIQQLIVSSGGENISVDTEYKTRYFINSIDEKIYCNSSIYKFEDHGYYVLNVTSEGCSHIKIVQNPNNIYLPLLYAFGVYFILGILWIIGKYLYRKEYFNKLLRKDSTEISCEELGVAYSTEPNSNPQITSEQKKKRLRSLDTFRGLSIIIMIFVNYGGGSYQFFHHALWNGLTVADLVFPWFIWIMGVSMALSLRSLLRKSISYRRIFQKILKRTIILFALGLMLNTFHSDKVDMNSIRIPGVLQRFAISYFVVATVHLFFAKPQDTNQHKSWAFFRDIFNYWIEWLIMLAILTTHVLLTFLLDVPYCGRGYLGPGGIEDDGKYKNCTGGAAGYIDEKIFGKNHLYQHPTFKKLYDPENTFGIVYDPEGTLGCLTSVFLVFLGLQAGKILLTYKEWKPRLIRWILWGILTGVIAAILCWGSKNDGWIPINKNLWSVSFIMATGSMSFILLSLCYFVCDVMNWWTGAPFFFPGMNSILLYVGHLMTGDLFPWAWKVEETHFAHLNINLWATSLWIIISIWLYYKKFFLAI